MISLKLFVKFEYQSEAYADILPFFTPNEIKKVAVNIYIGVFTKLTNQQPRTTEYIKSSFNIWNSKNSLPKKPAL